MALRWPAVKDPDEIKDYVLDWSMLLGSDELVTSTWSVEEGTGLVINSHTKDEKTATVWLSGGTIGVDYELLNRVTTLGGRSYDQSVRLKVKSK